MLNQRPRRAFSTLYTAAGARPSWRIEWRPGPPPRCPSVTGGQLTNALARDGAPAPGHSPPAQGRASTGQQAAAIAGVVECYPSRARLAAARLQVTPSSDLLRRPSKPNPGFLLLPFPFNTCSSACPPFSPCPRDTHR